MVSVHPHPDDPRPQRADDYTEADHDRALLRLAQDVEATPDTPMVITGQGDYRREVREDEAGGMFTATFMVCLAMTGALGLLGLALWAVGGAG